MDEEKSLDNQSTDIAVRKDADPPRLVAIVEMINALFKDTRPAVTGASKPITLHDTLNTFYLPDPDTTAKWSVSEKGEDLEMEAADDKGIVLVKGKLKKVNGGGWTEAKVTYAGGQHLTMELQRYNPGSLVPAALLRFSTLGQQKVSIPGAAHIEPGTAILSHQNLSPFLTIQYRTRFTI